MPDYTIAVYDPKPYDREYFGRAVEGTGMVMRLCRRPATVRTGLRKHPCFRGCRTGAWNSQFS